MGIEVRDDIKRTTDELKTIFDELIKVATEGFGSSPLVTLEENDDIECDDINSKKGRERAKLEAFGIVDSETKVTEKGVEFNHDRARTMAVDITEDEVWTVCELIRGYVQPDPESDPDLDHWGSGD